MLSDRVKKGAGCTPQRALFKALGLTDEEIRILNMLLDDEKVLRMSYGVLQNKKIHVTQGPLVNMDDYIVKYDKHNRLATLNLSFLNQIWKVGVTIPE